MDEDYQVSSEIFEEYNYISTAKPIFNSNYVVSKFEFTYPLDKAEIDSDGDLIVPRRKPTQAKTSSIEIEHMKSTALDLVGLQIWRGALLLADWLMYTHQTVPEGSYILELGAGVGLTSIVASMFAPVICTDINRGDILATIRSNIEKNKEHVKNPIKVMELDFMSEKIPQEIDAALQNVSVIIAADTVYDDGITAAFVKTVQRLLAKPQQRTVYVALEKRFVFTIEDCDSVAPCYEYYLRCLKETKNVKYEEVPLDFPQYFKYDRVKDLVLWKLTSSL